MYNIIQWLCALSTLEERFLTFYGDCYFHGGPNCRRVCHAITGMSILVPKCLDLGCWVWPKLTVVCYARCVYLNLQYQLFFAWFSSELALGRNMFVCLFFLFSTPLKGRVNKSNLESRSTTVASVNMLVYFWYFISLHVINNVIISDCL